jgi:hypothetical protein
VVEIDIGDDHWVQDKGSGGTGHIGGSRKDMKNEIEHFQSTVPFDPDILCGARDLRG